MAAVLPMDDEIRQVAEMVCPVVVRAFRDMFARVEEVNGYSPPRIVADSVAGLLDTSRPLTDRIPPVCFWWDHYRAGMLAAGVSDWLDGLLYDMQECMWELGAVAGFFGTPDELDEHVERTRSVMPSLLWMLDRTRPWFGDDDDALVLHLLADGMSLADAQATVEACLAD